MQRKISNVKYFDCLRLLHFIIISGALIEYAVILFKKQKLSKFGAPGQSAYPHQNTPMANYMSMRVRPNKDANNSNSTSSAVQQLRQQRSQQNHNQQQRIVNNDAYDMQPITSCRYNWNQGKIALESVLKFKLKVIHDLL